MILRWGTHPQTVVGYWVDIRSALLRYYSGVELGALLFRYDPTRDGDL